MTTVDSHRVADVCDRLPRVRVPVARVAVTRSRVSLAHREILLQVGGERAGPADQDDPHHPQ